MNNTYTKMDTKERLNDALNKAEDAAHKGSVRLMESFLSGAEGYAKSLGKDIHEKEAHIIIMGYSIAIPIIFGKAETFGSKNAPGLRYMCLGRIERYIGVIEAYVNSSNPDQILQQYAGMDRPQIREKIADMRKAA